MDIGPTELLIILAIVILLFGGGRIASLGSELGQGIRNFRNGLASSGKEAPDPAQQYDKVSETTAE